MKKISFKIINLEEIDSTNNYLKALAENGEAEGCVVTARWQTMGRGRRGKSFFSPADTGLYMSILLRPEFSVEDSLFITSMTAVALSRAIEAVCDKKCGIKWVNDIFVEGKKVAGILSEGSFDHINNKVNYIIVGIGVNLEEPHESFPDELCHIATSLNEKNLKEPLTQRILEEFSSLYAELPSRDFLKEYKQRSVLIGQVVEVLDEKPYMCRVLDIDKKCRLVVETSDKEIKILSSGEISTRLVK